MKPKDMIKTIQKKQENDDMSPSELVDAYKEVIALCKSEDDDYELLYSWYMITQITSHYKEEMSQCAEAAHACMKLLQPRISTGSIFHYTEMGKFEEEVIRVATNAIVWHEMSQTEDMAELEKLLDLVNLGCSYADNPDYFYIFDTKVRLLLKMGRKDDAYKIVRSCLIEDKHFGDFDDIKRDKDYKTWNENMEAGIVVEYTDEEKQFLQKAKAIHENLQQRIAEEKANKKEFVECIPEKEIITYKEAEEKYKIDHFHEDNDLILVFKGDLNTKSTINKDWIREQVTGLDWKGNLFGVLIAGNLTIDGDIIDDDYLELYVIKNLKCDYVFSYNGYIKLYGDADIKYGIYGEYNDGSIDIYGKLMTHYLIADDHSMPRKADCESLYIEAGNNTERDDVGIGSSYGSGWGWNWNYFDDASKLLNPAVWDKEEDTFSVDSFFGLVRNGENPFLEVKV